MTAEPPAAKHRFEGKIPDTTIKVIDRARILEVEESWTANIHQLGTAK